MSKRPETSKLYGAEIVTRRPAVLVPQGIQDLVELAIRKPDGSLYDLTEITEIRVRFVESISQQFIDEVNAEIVDGKHGEVRFSVPHSVSDTPGLYVASLGLFKDASHVDVYRVWIYVEPSEWSENVNRTLPQVDELRTFIRDSSPVENELLDSYQYFLTDFCEAIFKTVQYWNANPPFKNARTTVTFNYPYIMKLGIEYFLMESLLEWARKNRLPYQAGGVASDDLARFDRYEQLIQLKRRELDEQIIRAKAIEEISLSFKRLG